MGTGPESPPPRVRTGTGGADAALTSATRRGYMPADKIAVGDSYRVDVGAAASAGWESCGAGGEAKGGKGKGGGVDDYTVFPRRKIGRSSKAAAPGERAPVVLTEDKLRECFDLPLHVASKKMGICITAIKKVCRKFGIHKWPYRDMKERKVRVFFSCRVYLCIET